MVMGDRDEVQGKGTLARGSPRDEGRAREGKQSLRAVKP